MHDMCNVERADVLDEGERDEQRASLDNNAPTSQPANQQPTPGDTTDQASQEQWHTIKKIIRKRKEKENDLFLVEREENCAPAWVTRQNVTPYALQIFYANRKPRRRRQC